MGCPIAAPSALWASRTSATRDGGDAGAGGVLWLERTPLTVTPVKWKPCTLPRKTAVTRPSLKLGVPTIAPWAPDRRLAAVATEPSPTDRVNRQWSAPYAALGRPSAGVWPILLLASLIADITRFVSVW